MEQVVQGYRGLGLLFDVNNDRLLTILAIGAAMAAVGMVGVEYANAFFVLDSTGTATTIL